MLEVRNLSRSYQGRQVLDHINLVFKSGSFNLITGANGSGKTQLMRHLNGLLKPQIGEILLDGESIFKNLQESRKKIGLVFQNPDSQIVGQTVEAEIRFGLENLKWSPHKITEAVDQTLNEFNIEDLRKRRPHSLSGGEKRRINFASISVMQPDIIILDEPFSGLDLPGVQALLKDMIRQNKGGKTIIIITHDIEKVLAHCHSLSILDRGKLMASGKPKDLLTDLSKYPIHLPWNLQNRPFESLTWLQ